MIAIRDILIFLAGGILVYASILTRNYLYGKRISVSGMTQKEEAYRPRVINAKLPDVDKESFDRLVRQVRQVNMAEEFKTTHSSRVKDR